MQRWRQRRQLEKKRKHKEEIKKDYMMQQLEMSTRICSNCGKAGHQVQSCSMQLPEIQIPQVTKESNVTTKKKKQYERRIRKCGECKHELGGSNWTTHWRRHHKDITPYEAPAALQETNYDTMNALTSASTFGIQTTENTVSLPIMPQNMDIDEQNEVTWEEQKSNSIINQSLLEACLSDEESNEEKKKKQFQCPHCDRSYGYGYNLTKHIGKKHQDEAMKNKRELKMKRKSLYVCTYCYRKSLTKKKHKHHLKIEHKVGITVGRPVKNAKKAATNAEKRDKWLLRKIRQRLTFAITGNTGDIRAYLSLLLREKGFKVRENVAKGIRGLICGDAHIPTMDVTSHLKYKQAVKYEVPLIMVDQLAEAIDTPLQELQQDLETLQNEIDRTQCGDRHDMTHCYWRAAHRALSIKDYFCDALKYGEKSFTGIIVRALSALNVKGPQIELFIMNDNQKMHFVGVCRMMKDGMLKTLIFEHPKPIVQVQTQVPIAVAGSVIRNRRQEKEKEQKRKEEEKKKKYEEEKKKEWEYNQRGGFGFIDTPPTTPISDDKQPQPQPSQEKEQKQQNLSDSVENDSDSSEEVKQQPLKTTWHNQPALLDRIRNEAKQAVEQRQQQAYDYKTQREADIDMIFGDRSRERAIVEVIKIREAMTRKQTKKSNYMSDYEYGDEYQSSCNEESDNEDNSDTDNNDNMTGRCHKNSLMVQSKDHAIDSGENDDDDINVDPSQ